MSKNVTLKSAIFFALFIVMVTGIANAGNNDNTVSSNLPGTQINSSGYFGNSNLTDFAPLPNCGWSTKTPMLEGRWAGASAFWSTGVAPNDTGFIYYLCGATPAFALTPVVTRYNLRTNSWQTMAPLAVAKYQLSAVTVRNKIYLIGGYSGGFTAVNTNDIYNPVTNTWSTGAPMPVAVGDYGIGVYKDSLIYIVGGYNGSADAANVQIYNVVSNTWTVGTPRPGTLTAGLRAGISGNKLVILGGYSQTLATSVSDAYVGTIGATAETITWSANQPYPGGTLGRHAGGQVYGQNPNFPYVLFTGGDPNGAGTSTKVETYGYNTTTNAWDLGPNKTTGVSNIDNFVGITRNDTLYMVCLGGYNGSIVTAVNEWLCLGPATLTGISNNGIVPKNYSLEQNYPNPFNPTTNIKFALPVSGNVEVKVFDVLGNEVATIVNEYKSAGTYTADFDASSLSSGVYFYTLKSGSFIESKKMLLVK